MIKGSFGNLGKALSLFLALLILAVPILAQQTSQQQAIIEAEKQAKQDTNKTLWFIIGFFGNVLGLAAGFLLTPNPPATALLGKSSEYAAFYTETYQKKAKSIRGNNALYGCGTSTALWIILYVAVFAAAASTSPYYWY